MALLRRPTWLNVSQVASWGGAGWQPDLRIAQTETLREFVLKAVAGLSSKPVVPEHPPNFHSHFKPGQGMLTISFM
jgi:hypothetical protein